MECKDVAERLHGKTILVTGSTGYLAKLFVEKVLRVQPHIKKMYLLIRSPDNDAAAERLETQVLNKDLFTVLREAHGANFKSFISDKLSPIPGDIAHENMGIDDNEKLQSELDVIVHSAATTKFDERYDLALSTNTFGAKNVIEFAKKCVNLGMLLYVSTAYVSGVRTGLIPEKPFRMGESLNGISTTTVDIYQELKLAEDKLKELDNKGVTEQRKSVIMKELGLQRAKYFGWPNTYVFSKAMGEMLLGQLRDHVPLVIVRPTIVTATYMEPFPGWIENTRTIDTLLVAYALGKVKCFLADPEAIMDVVPGDMVINAMIMLLTSHFRQPSEEVYHLCSSIRNPPTYYKFRDWSYQYFMKHPHVGKNGKPIKVKRLTMKSTWRSFYIFMNLRFNLPLKVLSMINCVACNLFGDKYKKHRKLYKYAVRVALLYKPYVFFKGRFDDSHSEWLRATSNNDKKMFYYGIQDINWDSYFTSVHIPGVVKYLMI
ncbi:hypothetical protein H6P81_001763 [Aristolochia fimbriata]|uniref:Fatty acyl-CoA reductase n=1 Tax=Aristolochia fimbriata TaxID=158543 RepID=A0AAV7FAK1_ARIFI|nr:hypothetical protein H6P81_001763 [Aristolochia fimbriata]